jgi:hypothetical protein
MNLVTPKAAAISELWSNKSASGGFEDFEKMTDKCNIKKFSKQHFKKTNKCKLLNQITHKINVEEQI